jgi:hypothetical protein
MIRRRPWSALLSMLAPLGMQLGFGLQTGANGEPRRALILEIGDSRYQHGSFGSRKIAHLREGRSV